MDLIQAEKNLALLAMRQAVANGQPIPQLRKGADYSEKMGYIQALNQFQSEQSNQDNQE
ncbi:MAG: hypothetical protein ACRCXZ_08880 [Patescibacteria group bacterium]